GHESATVLIEDLLRSDVPVVASELTRFELLAGVRPDEHTDLEAFFLVVDWVPVTEEVVRRAGSYARRHREAHSGIGSVDYLIAGTATVLRAELLTVNVRHFPMFDGLQAPYGY